MELRDYARLLRKRWLPIVCCLAVGGGAAEALITTTTPTYEATTQLFVAASDVSGGDPSGLAQGGIFTQQRVQSYADIVSSPQVAAAVATQLGDGLTAKQIAGEISASAPVNTVLINVRVHDRSPTRAQAIANAVSDEFALFAAKLEAPTGSSASPVKVTVVKRADLPRAPATPRKSLDLAIGLLLGLVAGVGAAVLLDALDTSVKDPETLQKELAVPILGAISYDSGARKRPLIVHADPHSSRSEAFRQLRTNLQFVDIDNPAHSIVVTSSVPNEGKTTTATNLAIALAKSGMRVLLIEGDLRRPKMAEYLGVEGAIGLTNVLIGRVKIADAIQRWGGDSEGLLSVLPSGPTPPNPSELLGSRGMAALIRDLEGAYDLIVIDAPPLLPVTDAAVLANIVSGALVVARFAHTKREQLTRAVQSLRAVDATVYGVVLTMTPAKGPDAYYYGYGYRYNKRSKRGHAELITPVARAARVTTMTSDEDIATRPASRTVAVLRSPYPADEAAGQRPLEFFRS